MNLKVMAGLAVLARELGHEVSGSDAHVYPPMSDFLRDTGIALTEGWDARALDLQPDMVVIGNALSRGNPLVEAVLDSGIPYTSGAQWVAEQAGGFYIRNPENLPPNQPLVPLTNGIVQEFADMLATIAISSSDSVITKDEAKKIRARWEELKSVTEGFVHAAEDGSFLPVKSEAKK
jgi:hypothetical protein